MQEEPEDSRLLRPLQVEGSAAMVTKSKKVVTIEELSSRLVPILLKHQVSRAAIFGSVATGTARKSSDLDLLVEFAGERTLLDLAALKLDIESTIDKKVDVLTYRALHPLIRDKVLAQEVRIL